MSDFVNLRTFSHYSLFESIIRPAPLVKYCLKNNIKAVGLCDRMNFFGAVEFSSALAQAGIKPILGCLMKIEGFGFLPIYIKNALGYKNLVYILSQSYIRHDKTTYLQEYKNKEGLICLTGSTDSIFATETNLQEKIQALKEVFSDLFIEIQDIPNKNNLLELAEKNNLPIVCTSNVFFLEPEEAENLYVFRQIEKNSSYIKEDFENWPLSSSFMQKDLPSLPDEGLKNSLKIAQKCSFLLQSCPPQIPHCAQDRLCVEARCDEARELLEKYDGSSENDILVQKSVDGLQKKLEIVPHEKHENYWTRLKRELKVLIEKNFSGYFIVTSDFVSYARNNNIPVGPGRGSGAGSLVGYCLYITDIDPLTYDLIFERFLNPERNSMPDFDIDFCPEGRQKVIDYLAQKYGQYNVVNIITFGALQARGVIRDVCRVFNISFSKSDEITKLIPHDQVNPINLAQAVALVPRLKQYEREMPKVFAIALHLEGLIRNLSKHAAGIVICDVPVYEICPLYRDERGDLITQFNLQSAEYVGCVKFDFLGLRTLTIIANTCALIKERHKVEINPNNIPVNDKKAFDLLCNIDLEGIFQFESAGIRDIIYQLKPDSIEDLIAINALYRPGPIKSIPSYIKRKNVQEPVTYPHPLTEGVLKKTFGIIVYQEQVMDIARICAGYSLGEADLLRRAMGKKKPAEMEKNRKKFLEGAKEKGLDEKTSEELFALMSEFSGYGFNKSHSAPYSWIAYVCAYLKAHYTREFLVNCLSLETNDSEKVIRYIYSLRFNDIEILPPCVNFSEANFQIEKDKIRFSLSALKSIGEGTATSLVDNRSTGYKNIFDFSQKNLNILNKKTWDSCVYSGALDYFNIKREYLIKNMSSILKGEECKETIEKWSFMEKLSNEKKAFGFYLHHPLKHLRRTFSSLGVFSIREVPTVKNCYLAGEIISLRRRRTKSQISYAFAQITDESGLIDVTIFSSALNKEGNDSKLKEGSLVVFKCKVEQTSGIPKVVASDILTLDELLALPHRVIIYVKQKEDLDKIKSLQNEGETKVFLQSFDELFDLNQKISDSVGLRCMLEKSGISFL